MKTASNIFFAIIVIIVLAQLAHFTQNDVFRFNELRSSHTNTTKAELPKNSTLTQPETKDTLHNGTVISADGKATKNAASSSNKKTSVQTNKTDTPSDDLVSPAVQGTVDKSTKSPVLSTVSDTNNTNTTVYIVVQLSGEFGNHLSKIAHGRGIQLYLKEKHGLHDTKLIMRHQGERFRGKWSRTMPNVHKCFAWTRSLDFNDGYEEEVVNRLKAAETIPALNYGREFPRGVKLLDCLDQTAALLSNASFTPRVILADNFIGVSHFFLHQYQEDFLNNTFQVSNECCEGSTIAPDPDESVFHLRNFEKEMPKVSQKSLKWQEANPQTLATKVFAHLKQGDKVAIVGPQGDGRFRTDAWDRESNGMMDHKQALVDRGIIVRIISSKSFLHDFCFLRDAQKEFVGLSMSTFIEWASYLGNANKTLVYRITEEEEQQRGRYPMDSPPPGYQLDSTLVERYQYAAFKQVVNKS